jgi:hypothetical protein
MSTAIKRLLKKSIVVNSLTLITGLFFSLTSFAQVGIVPADPGEDPVTRAWFIETINPGETITRSATIVNNFDGDKQIELNAKDSTETPEGAFTFIQNEEEDKEVGSWIELSTNEITVPAQNNQEVEFTVTVPEGTEPGEYAGVISVQEKLIERTSAVTTVKRIGARIYITVPGDLKMDTEVPNLSFLSGQNESYLQFLISNRNINYKEVILSYNQENKGNIFTQMKGTIKVIDPTGKELAKDIVKDIRPGSSTKESHLKTGTEWQVGTYKAVFEWENLPIITLNKDNVTNEDEGGSKKEMEFEMTQEMLDEMKRMQEEADAKRQAPSSNSNSENSNSEFRVTNSEPEENVETETVEEDNTLLYGVIGGLVVVIILLAGGFGFILLGKKKNKKEGNNEPDK